MDDHSFYCRFHDVPAQKLRDMQTNRTDVGTVLKTGEFVAKTHSPKSASSDPLYLAKSVSTNMDSDSGSL